MPRWPMESTTPKAHRSRRSWHGREAVGARLSCARPPAGQHMRIEILSSPVEPCLMLASPLDPATGALIVGSNVRLAGRPQERAAPTVSRPCPDRMHRKRDDRGSQDISQLGALCAPLTNHGVPRSVSTQYALRGSSFLSENPVQGSSDNKS